MSDKKITPETETNTANEEMLRNVQAMKEELEAAKNSGSSENGLLDDAKLSEYRATVMNGLYELAHHSFGSTDYDTLFSSIGNNEGVTDEGITALASAIESIELTARMREESRIQLIGIYRHLVDEIFTDSRTRIGLRLIQAAETISGFSMHESVKDGIVGSIMQTLTCIC